MTSKLDYLKKYLASPGEGAPASAAAARKDRPKKAKRAAATQDIRIRDLSEVLPEAREERQAVKKKTVLAHGRRLCVDEDTVFVDKDVVDEAEKQRDDVEKSGVAWRIQQHRRPAGTRQASKLEAKQEVKEEVKQEHDGGAESDISPPRAPARASTGAFDGASARLAAKDEGDGSDLSPPRKGGGARAAPAAAKKGATAAKSAPAPRRQRHDSDSDLSPPRRAPAAEAATAGPKPEARGGEGAAAPKAEVKRQRHDSDSDLSPPRKAAAGGPAAKAEVKRPRHDSDSDLSPPRKAAAGGPAAKAEVKRERHVSDSDLSPPRKAAAGGPAAKAEGKPRRRDPDSDLSPPRKAAEKPAAQSGAKGQRHDSDSDLSPPRKTAAGGPAAGAEAQRKRHDSDSDLSPPRRAAGSSGAAAPEPKRQRHDSDSDLSPPRGGAPAEEEKMSSGLKIGLVKGSELKEQAAQVRAERKAALAAAPDEETGKGATTVYRNKDGRRIDREEWVEQQQKPRKKRKSDYPEQELEWGGGLKQRVNQEEQDAEVARIAAQPFARYAPDEKHLEALRERSDWNDPMRKFEEDQREAAGGAAGPGASAEAPKQPKPKCPHPPWPNRFNILPGYRWDGKVRGTDFEKRWLQAKNGRELKKQDAYRWEQEMDQ